MRKFILDLHSAGSTSLMAKHTGQPVEQIERDTDRDNFLRAEAAKEYGIVDQVLQKRT